MGLGCVQTVNASNKFGSSQTPKASNGFPGVFDPSQDIFFAFFDNRPDADDIHSQAGVATLLADQRFKDVEFYSVLGTYGKQGGAFLNSSKRSPKRWDKLESVTVQDIGTLVERARSGR